MDLKMFTKCGEKGGIFYQIVMTVLINIPIISFGLTMGWLSPNSLLLQSSDGIAEEPLSDEVISWMASVTFLAAIPAVFMYWYAADVWGRKPALICSSIPFAICWTMKLCSLKSWVLITARAIAGLGSSGCYVVVPLYVKEISQDSIRGALGSVIILAQNFGFLTMYILSDYFDYRTVLWGCVILSVAHVVIFIFMPESPSFLVTKNRNEEAASILAWLRRREPDDKQVIDELALLQQQEEEAEATKKESLKTIVADPTTFKAFRIALILVVAQEICGVFTMLMFASKIFETAGSIKLSTNQQTMLLGLMQLLGSIVASCTVEKVGRKPLLASTGYIVSACLFLLGLWFFLNDKLYDLPRWMPIVVMCLGIFCDSAGLQPVPYIIMSELFNFELRGMVSAAVMGATDLANFTELKIFHPIANSMGMHTCFWVFATITFIFSTYTVICVPETMGKTVDEIFVILRGNKTDKRRKRNNDAARDKYVGGNEDGINCGVNIVNNEGIKDTIVIYEDNFHIDIVNNLDLNNITNKRDVDKGTEGIYDYNGTDLAMKEGEIFKSTASNVNVSTASNQSIKQNVSSNDLKSEITENRCNKVDELTVDISSHETDNDSNMVNMYVNDIGETIDEDIKDKGKEKDFSRL